MATREKLINNMRKKHSAKSRKVATEATTRRAKAQPGSFKTLDDALAAMHKKYGKESIVKLTGSRASDVEAIPTGWQEFDDILTGETGKDNVTVEGSGIGIPRGRIVEVYGPEAAGKTTLMLHFIKAVQDAGGTAAYIDAEHALDVKYAANLGVDINTLLISQPDNAEQVFDMAIDLAKSGQIDLIVVDSVSALTPKVEEDTSIEKKHMGLQARLMSQGLRKLTKVVSRNKVVMLFVNQVRMKIGVMFGNPETTSGGNALKFYASVRLDIRKVKTLKKGTRAIGIRSRIRTIKNKVAPPFREIYVTLKPNQGITEIFTDPNFEGDGEDT